MANMCYLDISVELGSFEQADAMEKELDSMIEKNDHNVGFMRLDQLSLSYVYLQRYNHEVVIEAQVRWGTNNDEMKSLLRWFQARADVVTFEASYEEVASHMLGSYTYDDMEPDILWHHFLPESKWPEDEDSDTWFDRLYDLLENESTDRALKLTKQGDKNGDTCRSKSAL